MNYTYYVLTGMFAIHTDHAAELPRRVSGWMTWSSYVIRLAWLGFADSHSDITHYFVNVGTTYMGADLNKVSFKGEVFCLHL